MFILRANTDKNKNLKPKKVKNTADKIKTLDRESLFKTRSPDSINIGI